MVFCCCFVRWRPGGSLVRWQIQTKGAGLLLNMQQMDCLSASFPHPPCCNCHIVHLTSVTLHVTSMENSHGNWNMPRRPSFHHLCTEEATWSRELSIGSIQSSFSLSSAYIQTVLSMVLIFSISSSICDNVGSCFNTRKFSWFII